MLRLNKNKSKFPYIILISVNIYWGLTQILMKHALNYMDAQAYILLRFTSASIIFLPILCKYRNEINFKKIITGFLLGFLLAAQTGLNTYGLNFTSTTNSVFITQLSIVMVPGYYILTNKQSLDNNYIVTAILILLGLSIFSNVSAGTINKGDIIILVSTLIMSMHIILSAKYSQENNLFILSSLQMVGASFFSMFIGFGHIKTVTWDKNIIWIVFLTGIIGSGIANSLKLYSQQKINPISVSIINVLHPIFTMIGAALIPGPNGMVENITWRKIIGTIIILYGIIRFLNQDKSK